MRRPCLTRNQGEAWTPFPRCMHSPSPKAWPRNVWAFTHTASSSWRWDEDRRLGPTSEGQQRGLGSRRGAYAPRFSDRSIAARVVFPAPLPRLNLER